MSVLYDVLLYVALGIGIVLSHVHRAPGALPWTSRGTVLALVFALGLLLESAGDVWQLSVLGPGILLAVAMVALATLGVRLAGRDPRPPPAGSEVRAGRSDLRQDLIFPVAILAALGVGWGWASFAPSASTYSSTLLDAFLLLLLFQIGWGMSWDWKDLRGVPVPLAAALGSTFAVGALYAWLADVPWRIALAIVGAFGWYSLAGPLVAQSAGPTFGLIAFLANFLRENFTMTTSPLLARSAGADGIVAAGGATSMDTTLLFAVEHGGRAAGGRALAVGTILTLLAPVLLGLLLGTF